MNQKKNTNEDKWKQDAEFSEGLSITQEQVNDTLAEGTIDGKIDQVDKNGRLISHDGEEIKKRSE
ncbi:YozQ family protein [Halobacillus yeomjeoni]|uniref:YozQ family protein n=1 Tax=Halobacillus yeomjeoni TaxID=311194 RepID=A0A931HW88_9BACI|nr:YozQ family protein [Halobacillus yeomjeoni]MBH0230987.1 YozQ family protein [Halobacillus yeomjeoni]MCA0984572.1 YozQ family protein [Halobacillus yeomjeoni]